MIFPGTSVGLRLALGGGVSATLTFQKVDNGSYTTWGTTCVRIDAGNSRREGL
jgi:hypothetical protein